MIVRKDLAQADARVKCMRVLGTAGNAEAAASPDAEIPRLAIERLGGLGGQKLRADQDQDKNRTAEARRRGEQRSPDDARRHRNLLGVGREYQVEGRG